MKKILIVLGLALFLGTALSTVTEIQQVNAAATEFAFNADDGFAIVNFNDDEPKVAKTDKVDKKDAKAGCASAANCDKTKCAGKADAGAKAGCCSDKTKASAEATTKAGCCSKEKAVNDTDKK
jgi:hypothetical protein